MKDDNKIKYQFILDPEKFLVLGGTKISNIIKRDKRDIPDLVASGELDAWRSTTNGKWRALLPDLLDFIVRQKPPKK